MNTRMMFRALAWILVAFFAMPAMPLSLQAVPSNVPASTEMRGLWVTTAYNLDWPTRQGLTNDELRAETNAILARAANQGINAIFLQVRPTADAFYQSEIFPWSRLLTGTQGVAPPDGFDPLEYWITQAHAKGIEVHAWLNPYRVTFPNQHITDPAQLAENHPARLNPSTVIAYGTSLFFDPGNPAARQIILDGVEELLRNYNLDGIHLDDYFYPSRNFPDGASFAAHGAGMDLHDWRRENVNTLVRNLQTLVRETNPRARFGISPVAIWKNNTTDPLGSATRGNESFHSMYADTRRWVTEGWVDYIAPQIYWYTGFEIACYDVVLSWWEDVVRGTGVDLYIGHAVYREVEGRANWSGELVRQLERNARSDVVRGSIFFRERHMNSPVGEAIADFYRRHIPAKIPTPAADAPVVLMSELTVVQPRANFPAVTDASGFYFFGAAVPGVPVYVNGNLVENRTAEGFFSVFLPLVRGQNTFTFTQSGQEPVVRTLTNNPPAPPRPTTPVTPPQITEIGAYRSMFAEITGANTWAFPGPTTTGGSHWLLTPGQHDRVTATVGNWTRLAIGAWVENENIRTFTSESFVPQAVSGFSPGVFSEGRYVVGEHQDAIVWQVPFHPAIHAELVGRELIVTLGIGNHAPPIFFNPEESIFSGIRAGTHNGAAAYFMTLHENAHLEGFYTQYADGQIALVLRRRRSLTPGNYPFAGFTFVLDAGHGGNDPGALGPMGAAMPEAAIVLRQAELLQERLEMLGATVVQVRTDNTRFELIDRVNVSRAIKPDMFISLHTNATGEQTDATNIHGFTVWYRNPNSRPAAEVFMNSMRYVNPLTNRTNSPNNANFFVVRPAWSPAILLEASFTNNIHDFAWMVNPRRQVDYAWGVVNALLRYYGTVKK